MGLNTDLFKRSWVLSISPSPFSFFYTALWSLIPFNTSCSIITLHPFIPLCSLVSFSVCLSLVYRKATDFRTLSLYPTNLLKVFVSCRSFHAQALGSYMYRIRSSVNKITLISFFPICIHIISLPSLIVLRVQAQYWIGKETVDILVNISDIIGNALSFPTFGMMLAVFWLYITFIMLSFVPVPSIL